MELIKIIASGLAGCVIGFGIGYLIGSDNGFSKGCNWSYSNQNALRKKG